MILLSGADVVLGDRVLSPGTIVIEAGRIAAIEPGSKRGTRPTEIDLHNHYITPGFVDVHVHGTGGVDLLDGSGSIDRIAEQLPRHGVTAFCPTTVACSAQVLRAVLDAVRAARAGLLSNRARVLPAHLESNFLNPAFRGAQPLRCLCRPPEIDSPVTGRSSEANGEVSGRDILNEIERSPSQVGIVTVAPELPGGMDLVHRLAQSGIRVSLGHSGATFDEGFEAIAAGARHATHLFNRMAPLHHRDPGLAGAMLAREEVAVEVICDGVHVHPGMVGVAVAAKTAERVMAITDGTAGSGLPPGSKARLGGHTIVVSNQAAYLEDGTLAGSVQTMAGAFKMLIERVGLSLVDAAKLCASTPAAQMGLTDTGVIVAGAVADVTVLTRQLEVVQTYVGGELVYSAL